MVELQYENEVFTSCQIAKNLLNMCVSVFILHLQSALVISTLLISNNRLSRSENLIPVLTWKSNNEQQNIVEKRRNGH